MGICRDPEWTGRGRNGELGFHPQGNRKPLEALRGNNQVYFRKPVLRERGFEVGGVGRDKLVTS